MNTTRIILIVLISSISQLIIAQDIIKDEQLKSGLYEDFVAFRTNTPSVLGEVSTIKNKKGKILKYIVAGDTLKENQVARKYWGYCDGDTVYVNVMKYWTKLGVSSLPTSTVLAQV